MTTLVIDDKCDNKNTLKYLQVHIYRYIFTVHHFTTF